MNGLLAALIVAATISPRIPLPIVIPYRTFDIRLQDIVLVACLLKVVWSWVRRPRGSQLPRSRPSPTA